jgi:hypothetical protein
MSLETIVGADALAKALRKSEMAMGSSRPTEQETV